MPIPIKKFVKKKSETKKRSDTFSPKTPKQSTPTAQKSGQKAFPTIATKPTAQKTAVR